MGTIWSRPSHRDPTKPQIEFCDLCSNTVAAADRTLGTNQDFDGYYLCPDCAKWGSEPTFQDLGGPGNSPPPDYPLEPHSGANGLLDDEAFP